MRSVRGVDYPTTSNSVRMDHVGVSAPMLANYDSEIILAGNDQEFLNTSILSGQSRQNFYGHNNSKKSKSSARANRLHFGRIQQGNPSELQSYIVDGGVMIQENSRVSRHS